MDRITQLLKKDSLKSSFMVTVFIMVISVVSLSLLSIWGCSAVTKWLVPIRDEAMLHIYRTTPEGVEQSAMRIRTNGEQYELIALLAEEQNVTEYADSIVKFAVRPIVSPEFLPPQKMFLYNAMQVCMVALPMLYAIVGIILCSILFYNKKLAKPLSALGESVEKISDNDLDFTLDYHQNDEMGNLCSAFEKMRKALLESQRTTWTLMEERRQLNASIAHDIRTPVTIIQGYTEYLQRNLQSGKADQETISRTLSHLSESAARLERYVDSVRDIQNLDDMPVKKTEIALLDVIDKAVEDMKVIAAQASKQLITNTSKIPRITAMLDRNILFRILENTVSNAVRYAAERIDLSFVTDGDILTATIIDDGIGFSEKALEYATSPFFKESDAKEHMGLGLAISKTLCHKHDGDISIKNVPNGGAVVTITISIK